jgi:hypothetical protein
MNKMMRNLFMKIFLSIPLMILFLAGCSENNDNKDFDQLVSWMSGSFTSEEQSISDTNYFNIHLHMIPIWIEREEAVYLYVEQAASWTPENPYRQRVYKLSNSDDNTFKSEVYTIPNPARFAGRWKDQNPLLHLNPDSLVEKNGCAIILRKINNAFIGSTEDKKCPSNLRGADYATSEVYILSLIHI